MKPAFVLGNGQSRLRFNISELKSYGVTFGCNAIYRDFMPDHLIAVDPEMLEEIIRARVHYQTNVLANYSAHTKISTIETNMPGRMDSGNLATLHACQLGHKEIYLIGFDYISNTKYQNNVYVGTPNYKKQTDPHVLTVTEQSWYYRTIIMLLRYPDVKFIRVNGNNYLPPIHEKNFTNISGEEFDKEVPIFLPEVRMTPVEEVVQLNHRGFPYKRRTT
jgi:hypothetical protein